MNKKPCTVLTTWVAADKYALLTGWELFRLLPAATLTEILELIIEEDTLYYTALTCRGFRDAAYVICPPQFDSRGRRTRRWLVGPASEFFHRFRTTPQHVFMSIARLKSGMILFMFPDPVWRMDALNKLAQFASFAVFKEMMRFLWQHIEFQYERLDGGDGTVLHNDELMSALLNGAVRGDRLDTAEFLIENGACALSDNGFPARPGLPRADGSTSRR